MQLCGWSLNNNSIKSKIINDIQNFHRLHPTLTEKKRDINFIDTTRRPGT